MAHWKFPYNDYGEESGINAGYAAKFRGSPLSSLAREICQNSLDAGLEGKAVRVEFSLFYLPREEFPRLGQYENFLRDCLTYWEKEEQKNEINAFRKADKVLQKKDIPVLRISDFNTTGVRKKNSSEWKNLILSSGSSNKSGEANASFGLGKAAPFACSNLMTLFYSTNTCEQEQMHQGVARFATFIDGEGKKRRDVGYYSEDKSSPVLGQLCLDPHFERSEYGTDIYIMGFSEEKEQNWANELLGSIINNFLLAIMRGWLEASVQGIRLDKNSVGNFVAEHADCVEQKGLYYHILTMKDAYYKKIDVDGFGSMELWLTDKDPKINRKVSMVRKNGMKICEWNRFSSIPFAGICYLEGVKLNQLLRRMETPEHTEWLSKYIDEEEERKSADNLIKSLKKTIKNEIFSFLSSGTKMEMDAVGAGTLLPDDLPDLPDAAQVNKMPAEEKGRQGISLRLECQYEPSVVPHGASEQQSGDMALAARDESEAAALEEEAKEPLLPARENSDRDAAHDVARREGDPWFTSEKLGEKNNLGGQQLAALRPIPLTSLRSICLDPIYGHYQISALPLHDGKNGEICIEISAETGKFRAPILYARVNKDYIAVDDGVLKGIDFQRGKALCINFTMKLEGYYSLEVSARAAKL